ncbi:MAG TPA: hypothetical protein VHL09_17415 [Dehalococcoidia bacterium]|nr:hypothetical protein [Dehalococcoidia bacterium]
MSKTQDTTLTPRQSRAIHLIESGAVAIVPGLPYTIVKGSGKASYKVSRDACECADYRKWGAEQGDPAFMCKHREAVRALCDGIRILREEANRTGRVRLPAHVAKALANGTALAAVQARRAAELDAILFNDDAGVA